jgi:hypothetical protein
VDFARVHGLTERGFVFFLTRRLNLVWSRASRKESDVAVHGDAGSGGAQERGAAAAHMGERHRLRHRVRPDL